jgi:hypothetical protein
MALCEERYKHDVALWPKRSKVDLHGGWEPSLKAMEELWPKNEACTVGSSLGVQLVEQNWSEVDESSSSLVAQRFRELAERFENETEMTSSITARITHPAYLQIIALGSEVIPYLLADMQENDGEWFVALTALNRGVNVASHAETYEEGISAWLQWGKAQSYL